MPERFDPSTELTPEAREVLQGINDETGKLREIEFGETPPASVFEAE